ncbi:hypothetical protein O3M35_012155 [Rhynocoris fuscipes]|uniref:DNA/RNA-binding protein Alba-like domain-containing protein n=1 Tax=Rhynocoris fuscipes TaxID=488301 RepID=A0AAW1CXW0_9HEMI
MRNLLELALDEYRNGKDIVWTGSGAALGKTISCAEVMKKKFCPIYQFNKICYRRCEEHWDPKIEGLDPLVVNRDVPLIHILLSHLPINKGLPGFQMVGEEESGKNKTRRNDKNRKSNQRPVYKKQMTQDNSQMESYGLKFNRKKFNKKFNKDKNVKVDQDSAI